MSEAIPSPEELYGVLEESQYGKELAQRSRFGDFKPDWVDTETWTDLLGPDVNNLQHMQHTLGIAEDFAYGEELNPVMRSLLMTTAATHDIGEAIIGDIALPSKTRDDEKREEVAFRQIGIELYGFSVGHRLANKVWSVLNHKDRRAGDMFRAIEYVGYCTTSMRAGQVATKLAYGLQAVDGTRQQKEALVGGLLSLERNVSIGNYPVLAGYVKKYPSIESLV